MESTISLLSEKHFLCSLCEEIFSNPVSTPCGHSFCKMCLRVYWSRSGSDECPLCRRNFSSRPHLSVNRILADVTENYRKTRLAAKSKFFSMDELQDEPVSICAAFGRHVLFCKTAFLKFGSSFDTHTYSYTHILLTEKCRRGGADDPGESSKSRETSGFFEALKGTLKIISIH